MKLRFLVLVLIVGLMATTTFAGTIGAWIQSPASPGGSMSGNWTVPGLWKTSSNNRPPTPTTNTGDELKLNTPTATTVINTDLANYNCKLTIAGGMNNIDKHQVMIRNGAVVDIGQFIVGHGSSTDKGQWGLVSQSGGTVNAERLVVAQYGTRGRAVGQYIISGGTLQNNAGLTNGTGRLLIGAGITTGSTTANSEGTFTVVGADATISMKELYVGGYTTFLGTGNVNFKVKADGVTAITVSNSINLSATGIANLNVDIIQQHLGTIILVENTGASAVAGLFDSLNGGSAIEGAQVTIAGGLYTLTYQYDATGDDANNDIALIPEPATIALLGLGLIAIRRKK